VQIQRVEMGWDGMGWVRRGEKEEEEMKLGRRGMQMIKVE